MTAIRRGFVAVLPPPSVRDALEARVGDVRAAERAEEQGLRWAPREQWHCTLQFLGPVDDVEVVAAALGGASALVSAIPTVQLAAGGAFPTPRRGSVLWVGFTDASLLVPVAAAVGEACTPLGFVPEVRPYRPHVTVARTNRARDLRAAVDALGAAPIGPGFPVDELVLVSSDTHADGAVHEVVARFPLSV